MKRRAQEKIIVNKAKDMPEVKQPSIVVHCDDLSPNVSDALLTSPSLQKRKRLSDVPNCSFKPLAPGNELKRRGDVDDVPFGFWKRFKTDAALTTHLGSGPSIDSHDDRIPAGPCLLTADNSCSATCHRTIGHSRFDLQEDAHKFEDTTVATHLDNPFGCFNFWKHPVNNLEIDFLKDTAMEVDIIKEIV